MLKPQLANWKLCILVENDHILTFYHLQTSPGKANLAQTLVQLSLQKASQQTPELFSPGQREGISQVPLTQQQDKPIQGVHLLHSPAINYAAINHFSKMTDSQEYTAYMTSDSPNWLRRLVNQISQAYSLQSIFNTAVTDLRTFLEIDRVNICQFQPDGRLRVIAEAMSDSPLSSLLLRYFPTNDLSPYSQALLIESKGGAMVNLKTKTICKILSPNWNVKSSPVETTNYLPVDSHYAQALTNMGAMFSIVIPIFHQETAWGLLAAHHSEGHFISTRRFEVLQMVVEQLSVAVAQQLLRTQTQTKAEEETVFNRIVNLLQGTSTPEFQPALETAVAAFQGCGGRLCMSAKTQSPDDPKLNFTAWLETSGQELTVYTSGDQPEIPAMAHSPLMEQYRLWQDHYQSGDYSVWPISNLYQTPELQPLFEAFRSTPVDSLMMIPLTYRKELVGYLSVFRNSTASRSSKTESGDSSQVDQQEWTNLEFAQKLGRQFAMAIYEHQLSQQHQVSQQLQYSNSHLNTELQQHTAQLQQVAQQQQGLAEVLAKIKAAIDPETIFQTTTKELCRLLQAERVSVYRFNANWGGEFVHDFEYVIPAWHRSSKLGRNTAWNDTYLQETQGGRYRHNETFSADNIYEADLSPCHVEILEQFHIKAFATAPVFVGKRLWGVLAAYQHSKVRHWLDTDILFLSQTASSLGLALQQAELMAHNPDTIRPYQSLSKEFNLDSRSLPSG